jgi:hypothetical protein
MIMEHVTYIFELPLLIALLEEKVDIVSLSKTDAHDAGGDRLLIVANTAVPSELVGDLAVTEPLLTHLHHELIVRVELMRDTLVIRGQTVAFLVATTTEGSRDTRRRTGGKAGILVQDEGHAVVGFGAYDMALRGASDLASLSGLDALALLTNKVVVVLGVIILRFSVLVLVIVLILIDAKVIMAVELEVVIVVFLEDISSLFNNIGNHLRFSEPRSHSP